MSFFLGGGGPFFFLFTLRGEGGKRRLMVEQARMKWMNDEEERVYDIHVLEALWAFIFWKYLKTKGIRWNIWNYSSIA